MVHEILTSLDGVDVCEINITYDNLEVPRNQTGSAPHNNNNVSFLHSDGRAQGQPNRGQLGSQPRGQYYGSQHGPKHRDQTSAVPRGQQTSTNPSFLPRGQQHAHFNEEFNRRYSPPHSLLLDLITQLPVTLLVGPSFS